MDENQGGKQISTQGSFKRGKGDLFGNYLDPNVRSRFPDMSAELQLVQSGSGTLDARGVLTGSELFSYFVKVPHFARQLRQAAWREIFDKVDDYDAQHEKRFFDLYPELNIASTGDAATKEGPPRALVNRYFEFYELAAEMLFITVIILYWLRVDKLDIASRVGAGLKWSRLNTELKILKGLPLPKGLLDLVLSAAKALVFTGANGEVSLALPLLSETNSGYFEFKGQVQNFDSLTDDHTKPIFRGRVPTLPEMHMYGRFHMDDSDIAAQYLGATSSEFMSAWGTTGVGMIVRNLYQNLINTRDLIIARFGANIMREKSVWLDFYKDTMGWIEGEYDFTSISSAVREQSPVDGDTFVKENLTYYAAPGPYLGLNASYGASDLSVVDPRGLPSTEGNMSAGTLEQTSRELMTTLIAAHPTDRNAVATALAAEIPYLGFYIIPTDFSDLLARLIAPNVVQYSGGNVTSLLSTLVVGTDIGFINYTRKHGKFDGDDSPALGEASYAPFQMDQGERVKTFASIGDDAIVNNFAAILTQLAVYVQDEGELVSGIDKFNSTNTQIFLDPYLVQRGYFIPQYKMSPIFDDKDPFQMGLYRVLSVGDKTKSVWNAWFYNLWGAKMAPTAGFAVATYPVDTDGSITSNNAWRCFSEVFYDTIVWAGDSVYRTPNDQLTNIGLSRATMHNISARLGATVTPTTYGYAMDSCVNAIVGKPFTKGDSFDISPLLTEEMIHGQVASSIGVGGLAGMAGLTFKQPQTENTLVNLSGARTGFDGAYIQENDYFAPVVSRALIARTWIPYFYFNWEHPNAILMYNAINWLQSKYEDLFNISSFDITSHLPKVNGISPATITEDIKRILDVQAVLKALSYTKTREARTASYDRGGRSGGKSDTKPSYNKFKGKKKTWKSKSKPDYKSKGFSTNSTDSNISEDEEKATVDKKATDFTKSKDKFDKKRKPYGKDDGSSGDFRT